MDKNKKKKEIGKQDDLVGIEAICSFAEKDSATIMNWKNQFNFPAQRKYTEFSFTWVSNKEEIKKWFQDRGVNPKTVTQAKLQSYKLKRLNESGEIKKINKQLNGINEIVKFCGFSMATVVGKWLRYMDCPIKKMSGSILSCDADELLSFMHRHNIKRGSYNLAPRGFFHEF